MLIHSFNVLVVVPSTFFPYLIIPAEETMDCSIDGIPSSYQLVIQIIFCMAIEDFGFHILHRMLHWPSIYPHIHKIHHEYKVTIAVTHAYMHPLEFAILIIPTGVGPMILGKSFHITTAIAWFALRSFETVEGHTGYEFSWSPFRIIPFAVD